MQGEKIKMVEGEKSGRKTQQVTFFLHQKEGHGSYGKLDVLKLISSDGA
jgi:hypothetical protein